MNLTSVHRCMKTIASESRPVNWSAYRQASDVKRKSGYAYGEIVLVRAEVHYDSCSRRKCIVLQLEQRWGRLVHRQKLTVGTAVGSLRRLGEQHKCIVLPEKPELHPLSISVIVFGVGAVRAQV